MYNKLKQIKVVDQDRFINSILSFAIIVNIADHIPSITQTHGVFNLAMGESFVGRLSNSNTWSLRIKQDI